jgi:hypothetical protein
MSDLSELRIANRVATLGDGSPSRPRNEAQVGPESRIVANHLVSLEV